MFASQDADRKQNQTPPPMETGNKHQLFTGYFFKTKVHCHLPRNSSPNGNHFHKFQLNDFYSGKSERRIDTANYMSHWILIVFVRTDIEQGWTIRLSWSEKLPNLSLLIVEGALEMFRKHAQNDFCFFPFRFNLARLNDMGCDICPESLYLFKPQTQIMTYLLVFWKRSTYLVFRNEHVRLPSHFLFPL